jgi:hypothetical protein
MAIVLGADLPRTRPLRLPLPFKQLPSS